MIGDGKLAALYARAPEPSEPERTPIEEQLAACRVLAEALGYAVSDEATFQDAGLGRTMARPGISAMIALIAAGGVDAVVVQSVGRLAQPESTPLEALLKELRRRGIRLYLAHVPRGYRYDPATGELVDDPEEVAEATLDAWRAPAYLPVPRRDWEGL